MKIAAVSVFQWNMPLVDGEYVWAKGKRIDVADTAAVHLAQSVPGELCLGTWLCQ